ncbi:MAG: hypothetical protein M1359_08485 [Betaproteobacteria bacterium]|nr:hypothetical protein [Betaproteobacteria bacterium]
MNRVLRITLNTSPEQSERLRALQQAFAQACNTLAPLVQAQRCWNRVALHHMSYRQLRQAHPALGSQMVCNVIYSVCRAARLVYQSPGSPFNVARLGNQPLPLLRFTDTCAVYFDRHTLSLRSGQLSLYTLDGRMRFDLALAAADEQAFHGSKLRELVLARRSDGAFELIFTLQSSPDASAPAALSAPSANGHAAPAAPSDPEPNAPDHPQWPEFVMVEAHP